MFCPVSGLFSWLENFLKVALFLGSFCAVPDYALWIDPRPAHPLTWSRTMGGSGHCHCPSPAHTLRGEGAAWLVLVSPTELACSPGSPAVAGHLDQQLGFHELCS